MSTPPLTLITADGTATSTNCRYGWVQFRRFYQALLGSVRFLHSLENVQSLQFGRVAWKELLKTDKWSKLFDPDAAPQSKDERLLVAVTTIRELASKCRVAFPTVDPNVSYFGKKVIASDVQSAAWGSLIIWDINEHAVHQDLLLLAYRFLGRKYRDGKVPTKTFEDTVAAVRACMADHAFDFDRTPASSNGFGDADGRRRSDYVYALVLLMKDWKVTGSPVLPTYTLNREQISKSSYLAYERAVVNAYITTFRDEFRRLPSLPFQHPGIPPA
ncbi:hypothetical protein PUNSTDRAFT_48114 [Punctularia strigosozonata HHB-11173 SS5]|uniref:Uncharacterized protein n=1 Tax=Punctularia strigosozonata (strain HHB-11173) TaxID=741275 RepID=R7S0P8_PUNST|nr:uncharacterized protein PUNSTDRAFT_48114 [Punctularia strigosozonata HHB-11173 SS5]EIN03424.1 hypothetical protein PUNSTDRAFT_48114 [Punctularia strigosozonata HHB-11173 SS5]